MSVPQVAQALSAQPRTVRRVMAQLLEDEYLVVSGDGRRVDGPTMRLVALAGQIIERSSVAWRGRPYVALAHGRTGASAHLLVASYASVVCVAHGGGVDEDVLPHLCELVPAHCAAGGKVLLAWRDRWRESVLARPPQRRTSRSVTDARALRQELDLVRRQGYAVEDGQLQVRARAVAAPVRTGGDVVAALAVSGARFHLAAATQRVVELAAELSADLSDG